jgi:general stress protein 26
LSPQKYIDYSVFLESKLLLQLGTVDDEGDPNIQPVWFDYDKDRKKLLIVTPKIARKVENLRSNPNVYFSIDDEKFPYKEERKGHCNNNRRSKKNCFIWRKDKYEISWHTGSSHT